MKKYIFALIVACFLLIPATVAYADSIVEPDNDFYYQHENQIVYLDRVFCVNDTYGSASIKKEPGAKSDIAKLTNDKTVYLQYSCLYDGEYWGFALKYSGWIKMEELLVLYDYVAFGEEHLEEFYAYEGDYSEIKKTDSAIAWPWPGAETSLWTIEDLETTSFSVSCAYKDGQGREWGFVPYFYGNINIWVCLSDPLNSDIPAFNPAPEPITWVSDTAHIDIGKDNEKSKKSYLVLAIILVAALAIGTAILIKVFWKSDKNKKPEEIEPKEESND